MKSIRERNLCVISTCTYASVTICGIINELGDDIEILDRSNLTENNCRTVIAYIARHPFQLLNNMNEIYECVKIIGVDVNLILISDISPKWLRASLCNILDIELENITIVKARCSVSKIKNTIDLERFNNKISCSGNKNNKIYRQFNCGITGNELKSLLVLLSEKKSASKNNAMSNAKIVDSRTKEIKKLKKVLFNVRHSSSNLNNFKCLHAGYSRKNLNAKILSSLIQKGDFFPEFYSIVNDKMNAVCFDVIVLWYKNGIVLSQSDFLDDFKKKDIWHLVVKKIINEIVYNINSKFGKVNYSINITECVDGSLHLVSIVQDAISNLKNKDWVKRLELCVNENIFFQGGDGILKTLSSLKDIGVQLCLDNCFASASSLFPIRDVKFDTYKLSPYVVKQFLKNETEKKIIEELIFYTNLIGSGCVAKGVNTKETLFKLKEIGVCFFQGDFISINRD